MTVLNENARPGEAIMSEGMRSISRENVTIAESQTIPANGLIAKMAVTAAVDITQAFTGTGNGVLTLASPAYNARIKDGVYKAVCTAVAANGGKFEVSDPAGVVIGIATVGSAFNKEIKFTIADGATDFVAGDTFDLTVAANVEDYSWVAFNHDGTDGSEIPAAYSIYAVTTGSGETKETAAIIRLAELNGNCIAWPTDIDAAEKANAIQALATNNIIVRY